MWKKILFSIASMGILFVGGFIYADATTTTNYQPGASNKFGDASATAGYGVAGTGSLKNDELITIIKNIINRCLGMLSLVALILCLWGGFQILTAAGDEKKQSSGLKVIKTAAIGLAVIGISWLMVSLIFRLIEMFAGPV